MVADLEFIILGTLPNLLIEHSTISNNSLTGSIRDGGGGLFIAGGQSIAIRSSIIADNQAGGEALDILLSATSPVTIDLTGVNLIGDLTDTSLSPGPNVIVAVPQLAPLGDYGGPTQTMPPLPGSPAINAAGLSGQEETDQRGLSRFVDGALDIGAVEYQGSADLARFFPLDFDGDGSAFGVEYALGTDPLRFDAANSRTLSAPALNSAGEASLSFGLNLEAVPHVVWILKRSTNLQPGSFEEIYRFDGPSMLETLQLGVESAITPLLAPDTISITDRTPPSGTAFYRFEAELEQQ